MELSARELFGLNLRILAKPPVDDEALPIVSDPSIQDAPTQDCAT